MTKDKLTRDERIRLEALRQAIQLNVGSISVGDGGHVLSNAKKFEEYVRGPRFKTTNDKG